MVREKIDNVRVELREISDADNPPENCPQCLSHKFTRFSYYFRDIQDLGTPDVKKMVRYETVTWKCPDCDGSFIVKHPEVLDRKNYMPGVVKYVRQRVLKKGDSARRVLADLNELHNVDVTITTINNWINLNKKKEVPTDFKDYHPISSYSGAVSYDGTFRAVKSKKNEIQDQGNERLWLQLTHLQDGRLVAYWRMVKVKKNAKNSLKN
jgi:transposase-like protein